MIDGLVSTIEEFESARACGYTWTEWKKLDYTEKTECVALCRASRLIEMHSQDASTTEAEKSIPKK